MSTPIQFSGYELWEWLYNKTKAPLAPLYGGFPVKLTTYIGDAIYPDCLNVDEVRAITHENMKKMIKKHQILPGSIFRAIAERFISENVDESDELLESEFEDNEELYIQGTNYRVTHIKYPFF